MGRGCNSIDQVLYSLKHNQSSERNRIITPGCREQTGTIDLTKQPIILGAGVASLDSQLYAIGGYDGTQHLNSTECYSACADRWMTLKDMNCKRCYVGEFLYFTKALY